MLAALLRLFRIPNLAILVGTVYLVAQQVIYPPLIQNKILSQLTPNELYLVLFIVVCIGGGGYLFNDIVDVEADKANGRTVVIDHFITRHLALVMYYFITLAPLVAVFSLVIELERPALFWGYISLVLLFWAYNKYLQSIAVAGNITVALLCSLGIILPLYLEYPSISVLLEIDPKEYHFILSTIIFFSTFAFLSNLAREIIKDIEDIDGDRRANQRTLPIITSIDRSKNVVGVIMTLLAICIGFFAFSITTLPLYSKIISLILLTVPLGVLGWQTIKANQKEDYTLISQIWKAYFVCGVLAIIFMT